MKKKGWIRIFEAIIAVLLVASVLLIVVSNKNIEDDISLEIYEIEISILREIQLDDSFRQSVLDATPLPIEWDDFDSRGLGEVKLRIIEKTPDYLGCKVKVCNMEEVCILNEDFNEELYVQSVAIVANLDKYDPRQLKLFCWEI